MRFLNWMKNEESYEPLDPELMKRQREIFEKKKKFEIDLYDEILSPYLRKYEILSYAEYVAEEDLDNRRILLIRHDIDHDFETAKRLASWEAARGIRATYCVLHTSWYYGHLVDGRYRHSKQLVELCRHIHALGHEINFHNNLVAAAMYNRVNPYDVLAGELEFFRNLGIDVVGTSTHGDRLCRELKFRNYELFEECVRDDYGGKRMVSYEVDGRTHSFLLGSRSMKEYDLQYEAYDIIRDRYHTDSGGRYRTIENCPGRRPFGRKNPNSGHVVGILTHPIWWKI